MQKTFLTVLGATLIAALTAQVAPASEHHHTRTNGHGVVIEQLRNSNAYAASGDIAVRSVGSEYAKGAMASGPAGR